MYLPLYFKVVSMHASESGPHEVVICEQRRQVGLSTTLSGPQMPAQTIAVNVTAEQFSNVSIGQLFGLEPSKDEALPKTMQGPVLGGAVAYR